MTELDKLLNQRKSVKSRLTRFETFVRKIETDESLINQLSLRMERIKPSLLNEYDQLQDGIEMLSQDEAPDREEFENRYYLVVAEATKVLSSSEEDQYSHSSNHSNTNNGVEQVQVPASNIVQLPKITLPTFDGTYSDYKPFIDIFLSLIDQRTNLQPIQKMHYLRSCLKDKAYQVLASLETSDANYQVALDLLKTRYDNKRLVITQHIKTLVNQNKLIDESAHQLRNMLDNTVKHLSALKALGEPVDTWSSLVQFIITNKFDPKSKRAWEEKCKGPEMPLWTDFIEFLEHRCQVLEGVEPKCKKTFSKPSSANFTGNKSSAANFLAYESTTASCTMCNAQHFLYQCRAFLSLSKKDRWAHVKKYGICFNCLRKEKHTSNQCPSGHCKQCKKKHSTLLHSEPDQVKASSEIKESTDPSQSLKSSQHVPVSSQAMHVNSNSKLVLLATAVVYVRDKFGEKHLCRVMLDSGSQSNFISERMANILSLPKYRNSCAVRGITGDIIQITDVINCIIESRISSFSMPLEFLIIKHLSLPLPTSSFDTSNWEIPLLIKLADPEFFKSRTVDMFIGAQAFYELISDGKFKFDRSSVLLQNTKLGWIVSGQVNHQCSPLNEACSNVTLCCSCVTELTTLEKEIQKFWIVEELQSKPQHNPEEQHCEKLFGETTTRDPSGRFIVSLPFKESISQLGNSKEVALRRFFHLERRLAQNSDLKEKYIKFMDEYINLNHMQVINREEWNSEPSYYLPHHPVVNEASSTTKLRVVFDGSSKSTSGISLNDTLMVGGNVQDELFEIITRFRKHQFVMTADIQKMYRQISVKTQHTNYQRIIWRKDPSHELKIFKLTTVTYGTSAAPYLATRCLKQLSLEERNPAVSRVIEHDFYVDDLLTGAQSIQELITIQSKLISTLEGAGFILHKWCANHPSILNKIDDEKKESRYTPNCEGLAPIKTLGLWWNPIKDTFQFDIKVFNSGNTITTKRMVVSHMAKTFDPLGLLGPITVRAKMLVQLLWDANCNWDEQIPLQLQTRWNTYCNELNSLSQLTIPRLVLPCNAIHIQLHSFSDASERAYGACVYLRCVLKSGQVSVALIASKSRVAPIKKMSLPRLELCGALLAAKLSHKVRLALQLPHHDTIYWTDSNIVLAWICSSSGQWKTFVANKVAEIHELTENNHWRHVNSKHNPADCLSRGLSPQELLKFSLWWSGPPWLVNDSKEWPLKSGGIANPPEQKKCVISFLATFHPINNLINKYSSYTQLLRVTAYVNRFINNLRTSSNRRIHERNILCEELEEAVKVLVRIVQEEAFPLEVKKLSKGKFLKGNSKLASLNPFLDGDGIIRVGGRINKALSETPDKREPIVLPYNHYFSTLIIRHEHERLAHAGTQLVLANIRSRFWPLKGKQLVSKIIHRCIPCFKVRPIVAQQLMGSLPKERLEPMRPFLKCGVDYCGPFYLRATSVKVRKCQKVKAYVAMFVCLSTKAIHIELVSDLTTESFLGALTRFFSRRGKSSHIFSDNATNFVGANRDLCQFLKSSNFNGIQTALANKGVKWTFIPARSPNFGGLWEASIKLCKHHMKRVVGNAFLTFEEMNTVITRIEACLNSRPITPLTSNPTDLSPLTPGHFLVGESLTAPVEQDLKPLNTSRLARWQRVQQLSQHFWARWSNEYLSTLQPRQRWNKQHRNLKIGDMVLLKDDNLPPLQWRVGRVKETHPGADGLVRVVTVYTSTGQYRRAISSVCPLPIEEVLDEAEHK